MKHLWWQTITAWILLWKEASIVCSAGIPTRNITTVILRRSRKAGSGTLDAFLKDAIKAHPEVTTYEAKLGTMHPFDSCCLVPCAGSKPPWSDPSVFTVTHLREPLDWRQSEYWYAGAGSSLVLPTNPVNATSDGDASLWAAWMAEQDSSLKPRGDCGREPVRGYTHFSNGFGFYQPDFMVRNVIAECQCPDPFERRKEVRKPSFGDCHETGRGNTALATRHSGYRPLQPSDLTRAKRILEAFDLVVPTVFFNHSLLPRFILWKAGWLEPCDGHWRESELSAGHERGESFRTHRGPHLGHVHRSELSSRHPPVPPCILAALREQNQLEASLFAWAVERFDRQLQAFAELGPKWTCDT